MSRDAEAMRLYMKRRYHERRAAMIEHLGGTCRKCGSAVELEIDHIDRTKKTMTTARMTMVSWERCLKELINCQLLCHECHVAKTKQSGDNPGPPIRYALEHGTSTMYGKSGCRCETCRRWKKLYRQGVLDTRGIPVL